MLAHNQGALLNASRLAAALMVSAQTTTRYVDLLVDLLLVRRLRPFHHTNSGNDRYAIAEGVEAIGLEELVTTLSTL